MSKHLYILLFVAFITYMGAKSANAQQNNLAPSDHIGYLSDVTYQHLAKTLLQSDVERFNYVTLRGQYAKTDQYDPIGSNTLEDMRGLAFEIKKATSKAQENQLLQKYYIILQDHIAHIAILSQAILLSQDDPRFGDAKVLKKIRNGLFDSIMSTGDGLSPESAYEIVTLAEETIILRQSGYEIIEMQVIKRGVMYYNAHKTVMNEKGLTGVVFTNITLPMQKLSKYKKKPK